MKLLGLLLIFLTGTGCGLLGRWNLKRRSDSLERITRLCEQLAEDIRHTAAPLDKLLCSLASTAEFRDFPLLCPMQEPSSDDPRQVLSAALTGSGEALGLTVEDRQLFAEFIADFGTADLVGEVQRCRRYAALFRERHAAAREIVRQRGRLYVTLGFCVGCTLSLVLL